MIKAKDYSLKDSIMDFIGATPLSKKFSRNNGLTYEERLSKEFGQIGETIGFFHDLREYGLDWLRENRSNLGRLLRVRNLICPTDDTKKIRETLLGDDPDASKEYKELEIFIYGRDHIIQPDQGIVDLTRIIATLPVESLLQRDTEEALEAIVERHIHLARFGGQEPSSTFYEDELNELTEVIIEYHKARGIKRLLKNLRRKGEIPEELDGRIKWSEL